MKLSLGTKIEAFGKTFTIIACGNGYYTVKTDSGLKWTLPVAEAIADIKSGVAKIVS